MQLNDGDVKTALIDADIMLYRAAWKHEGENVENAYKTIDAISNGKGDVVKSRMGDYDITKEQSESLKLAFDAVK